MADTLLLVDDDASVLRAIGDYFERIGYEVWRDGTGEQAMETFHRVRPDVVLLDLHLPGQYDGFDVCRKLRATPSTKDVPVVIISAKDDAPTRAERTRYRRSRVRL